MTRTIFLTGAASGIGRETARQLANTDCRLVLADRDAEGLARVAAELPGNPVCVVGDLGDPGSRAELCQAAIDCAPDVLINNAGILHFAPLESLPIDRIESEFRINVIAPIALAQAVLPGMRERGSGHIINLGSVFGSISFAYFSTYSSSKFAIRGFTEALRRETAGSGIDVSYVAPRAVKTALASQFGKMAAAVGMNMDTPERVAKAIVNVVGSPTRQTFVGFPESFFVKVNGLFPGLVDRSLRKKDEATRPFAEESIREVLGRAPAADVKAGGPNEWAA